MAQTSVCVSLVIMACACSRTPAIPTTKVVSAPFTRRVTAEGNLKALKATPVTAPHEAPNSLKVAWIADDGAQLKKDELIARFDATDFEKELLNGNEDHQTAANSMARSESQSMTTRTNLRRDATQAERELDAARRFKFDDAEAFSRFQRVEAEMDATLAAERKSHAERVLPVRDGLSRAERELLEIDDRKAGLRIRNAKQGLSSLEMRAPHDGILVLRRDWRGDITRVGATVWPGQPLGEIPDLSKMNAEVFVLEGDAAGLATGEKAIVTLESNPELRFNGTISSVDKLARPRIRNVPVQYFGVTIALEKTDARVMKPGTRVRAVLDVENRASAFAIPRQAMFEKDGKHIVYVRHGARFDAQPVTIASSSAGRVVVTKGIVEGDELALVDPAK